MSSWSHRLSTSIVGTFSGWAPRMRSMAWSRRQEFIVVVVMAEPPLGAIVARAFLLVDVGQVLLSEGAVMKPVITHPAVHHGIHRHRYLERRVRVHQGHERQKAVIGNAQNAD